MPFPPWDRRPQIPLRLAWVWTAFHELGSCRPMGQVVGSIPWTAIDQYAERMEVLDAEAFHEFIRALDAEFLAGLRKPDKDKRQQSELDAVMKERQRRAALVEQLRAQQESAGG